MSERRIYNDFERQRINSKDLGELNDTYEVLNQIIGFIIEDGRIIGWEFNI